MNKNNLYRNFIWKKVQKKNAAAEVVRSFYQGEKMKNAYVNSINPEFD